MASDDEDMEINKEDDDEETSSDSSEEQIDDEKQETALLALAEAVKSNPYNYQGHVNYIALARECGNLEHLRLARQSMSEIFPLTEQLWLDWLRDEQQLTVSTADRQQELTDLFERATNDYLSVMIWIEYVQYRISIDLSANAIEELRNLFERALSVGGVHLTDGHLLWAAFIEVEKAKLIALAHNYSQNTQDETKEKLLQQVDFILQLYRRQLSIPLRKMDLVYNEYHEFYQDYKQYLPANYAEQYDLPLKRDYDHAVQQLEQHEKLEKELESTQRSLITYRKYIQAEHEPTRLQCLYERAIGKSLEKLCSRFVGIVF